MKIKITLIVIMSLIVALLIFQAGLLIGYHKARFSEGLGENYFRGMPGGHGAVGQIVKVSLPSIVIEGPDNIEKEVVLDGETLVRNMDMSGTSTDLKEGDFVTVLGFPNDQGQVQAKLIRVLPPRP